MTSVSVHHCQALPSYDSDRGYGPCYYRHTQGKTGEKQMSGVTSHRVPQPKNSNAEDTRKMKGVEGKGCTPSVH